MNKKQYLNIEMNITEDERIECLMEKYGTEGFGIYILILKELCKHENQQCSDIALQKMARTYQINEQILESITHDFDLFTHTMEEKLPQWSSPYIDEIMKKTERKNKERPDRTSSVKIAIKRDQNGRFADTKSKKKTQTTTDGTATDGNTKTIMETTTNTNGDVTVRTGSGRDFCPKTTLTNGTDGNSNSSSRRNNITTTATNWKTYLDKAIQDETWMKILTINSGMGKQFISQRASPYPYETIDPATEERSYCGCPIPPGAPPRPSRNSFWHEEVQTATKLIRRHFLQYPKTLSPTPRDTVSKPKRHRLL